MRRGTIDDHRPVVSSAVCSDDDGRREARVGNWRLGACRALASGGRARNARNDAPFRSKADQLHQLHSSFRLLPAPLPRTTSSPANQRRLPAIHKLTVGRVTVLGRPSRRLEGRAVIRRAISQEQGHGRPPDKRSTGSSPMLRSRRHSDMPQLD